MTKRTVSLSGDLTIQNADSIFSKIHDALIDCEHLEIECSRMRDVDVSFIQMLFSVKKTIENRGGIFRITPENLPALTEALARGGFGFSA